MSEQTEAPAPTRDEILQSHFDRLHADIEALPGRIFGWFFGAACVGLLLGLLVWALLL